MSTNGFEYGPCIHIAGCLFTSMLFDQKDKWDFFFISKMDANERSLQSKCQRGQQWKQSRKLVLNYMHTPYTHADSKHWMILLYCAMLRLLWDIHKIWDYQRIFWTRKPCHWNKWRWDHFIIIIIFIENATEKLKPKEMEIVQQSLIVTNWNSKLIIRLSRSILFVVLIRVVWYARHWFYTKSLVLYKGTR